MTDPTDAPSPRGGVGQAIVTQLVLAVLLAGLAISRAAHGVVDGVDLVLVVTGASLVSSSLGFANGAFDAAGADQSGRTIPASRDLLEGPALWRRAALVALAAVAWTVSGAIVVAAVIGDRAVGFPAVAASMALLAGGAAVGVDIAGRRAGAAAARRWRSVGPTGTDLHRRAWWHIAIPVGITQVLGQGIISWVLFHDAGRPGAPELTEEAVLADAVVVVTIIVGLIGAMAANWGRVDQRSGRVRLAETPAGPIGGQAFVLLALAAVVLAGPAGWLVPSEPSLARTIVVRAVLSGGLGFLAAGLGYARGVVAAAVEDEPLPTAPRAVGPSAGRGSALTGAVASRAGLALLAVVTVVLPGLSAGAQSLDDLSLLAEGESFAVRVEYDIPLPVDSGSAPHVKGEIRRSVTESAQGLAASPSNFNAVVAGSYANPDEDLEGEESRLPVVECFAPGDQTDVAFGFPTDNRDDTAGLPATSYATAHCATGPSVELHARSVSTDAPGSPTESLTAAVTMAGGTADLLARTVDGRLEADTAAAAEGVSLLGGLVTVDSIEAVGRTSLDGTTAGAFTEASVNLHGVEIAGLRFDVRAGQVFVDGQEQSGNDVTPGDVLAPAVDALAAQGCSLTVLDDADRYPQGFLLARKDPFIGMGPDGGAAGSMAGGLLIVCDIPDPISEPTGFSPQRAQFVLGFAMTTATVRDAPGGFGLADLVGGDGDATFGTRSVTPAPAPTPTVRSDSGGSVPDGAPAISPTSVATADDEVAAGTGIAPTETILRSVLADNPFDDSPVIWATALTFWLAFGYACMRFLELTGNATGRGEAAS